MYICMCIYAHAASMFTNMFTDMCANMSTDIFANISENGCGGARGTLMARFVPSVRRHVHKPVYDNIHKLYYCKYICN